MAFAEHLEEEVVVGMYDRGLLGFPSEGVRLKSGRLAPYYYNMRRSLSISRRLAASGGMDIERQLAFRRVLARAYGACFREVEGDGHVFGKAQSGTAPVALGAYEADMSYLWERVEEPGKAYGIHGKIEGDYEAAEVVRLGDDVITDGAAKVEGINTLQAVGLVPVSITVQFDREEGGAQFLSEEYGLQVNAVTSLSRAIGFLVANSRIDNQAIDGLQAYHDTLRADGVATTFGFSG